MAKGSVYEGKTFDDAVRKGLDELRLSRAEALVTLIEEGKGGFLGLGSRPFRVSVMRRPGGAVREPEEQRERRVGGRRDERRSREGGRGGRDRDRGGERGGERDRGDREGGRDKDRKREERRGPQPVAAGGRDESRRDESRRGESRREGRRDEKRDEKREGRRDEPRREGRRDRDERRPERREERPQPVAAVNPPVAPDDELEDVAAVGVAPAGGEDAGEGAAGERRRRRRGRRGGRGRRRGGVGGHEGESSPVGTLEAPPDVIEADEPEDDAVEMETVRDEAPVVEAPPAEPPVRHETPTTQEVMVNHDDFVRRDRPARPADGGRPRDRDRDRDRGRDRGRDDDRPRRREHPDTPAASPEELEALSRKVTEDLLRAMGFEPKVSVKVDGTHADVLVEVDDDRGLLTGEKGETRLAIQQLLNRFANRGEGSRYHLQLEVNDFWQRREEELEAMAKTLADEAVASGAETHTAFLSSQERRIVHMALRSDARVRTDSRGEDTRRFVVVFPVPGAGGGASTE
jgi:spoIIIJ-associated protein